MVVSFLLLIFVYKPIKPQDMKVTLKRNLKSAKFNVTFKKGIKLNYSEGLQAVEHPTIKNLWLKVTPKQFIK